MATKKAIVPFRVQAMSKPRTPPQPTNQNANSPTGVSPDLAEPPVDRAVALDRSTAPDQLDQEPEPTLTVRPDHNSAQGDVATVQEATSVADVPSVDTPPEDTQKLRLHRQVATQMARGMRFLAMPLVWISLLAFCGGSGVAAFLWLATLPPLPDCKRLNFMSGDLDRLICAEQFARSGNVHSLVGGLTLVKHWAPSHPLYARSKPLIKDWSKAVMVIAHERATQGNLEGAIGLARQIPANSPLYKTAQTTIADWQKSRTQQKAIEAPLQAALQAQNWEAAEQQVQKIAQSDSDYWRQQTNRLRQRIITERLSHQQLVQARELVQQAPTDSATLATAIAQAKQIVPSSYAAAELKQDLAQWQQALLKSVSQQLTQNDLAGAIAVVPKIPLDAPLPPDIRDLIWFERAQRLVAEQPTTKLISGIPIYQQLWQYLSTLAAAQRITVDRPFYAQAQTYIPQLQTQAQDLTQVQLATAVASSGQLPALYLGMLLAQGVAPNRPQRIYAQTLIAQWRKEIQQGEDQANLTLARQLAKAGTLPYLKAAIAQASNIPLGRALRPQAQTTIYEWKLQIQALEDKPILDQARTLAKQNKLSAAIQTATKIQPGRILYNDAQTAIQVWTRTSQIQTDRPILNQAKALAKQGKLGAALDLAYQIGSNRALSSEVQAAIGEWEAQLAAIQQPQVAAPAPDSETWEQGYDNSRRDRSSDGYR
ncbi:hypothetical protein [Pantanalinema sp. GBBB05]|uniref:hypothetical protein n=1 Tax=Pantanalinema sp. GBBB05 TaxID=2604139 RepID=UPI001D798B67|nr:hypothetical protein [Pantanalinema sp. GBBB05]